MRRETGFILRNVLLDSEEIGLSNTRLPKKRKQAAKFIIERDFQILLNAG